MPSLEVLLGYWLMTVFPGLLVVIPAGLVVKQPDLSTGILLMLIALSVLAVTELNLKTLLGLLAAGVVSFMIGWSFLMEGYQTKRVNVCTGCIKSGKVVKAG